MTKRAHVFILLGLGCMIVVAALIYVIFSLSKPKLDKLPMDSHTAQTSHTASHVENVHENVQSNMVTIDPQQLQSIGITFADVKSKSLEKEIRTVGRVEVDERKITPVTLKVEGWVEKLLINYTGAHVEKGDILFTIYSPELVATEQEYLLALQAVQKLKNSKYSEVAQGATALLEAAKQRLRLWDIAKEHIQKLNQTRQVEKTLPIHSPLTGTVIEKMALAGMQVNPGDKLYVIADLSHVWVLADIYEQDLPEVKVGQLGTIILSYSPDKILQGKISFISPITDAQTRTTKARFEFDNSAGYLKPGMYVNVNVKVQLGKRLIVPKDAIIESGERAIIFVYLGGGKLEWRNVKTGVKTGDWIEVLDGVREGEKIVTSANFLIDSESQLKAAMGGMQH